MGFLDDIQASMNRGMASVERTGRSTKIKMQQTTLLSQRKDLAAQLGASLYEATKDNPEFRAGRESLYDDIANIDQQRAALDAELAQIEQEAAAQAQAAVVYICPKCGGTVRAGEKFCSGCGTPVSEIIPQQAEPVATATCSVCGAPINPGDKFCMSCGAKQGEAPVEPAIPATEPAAEAASAEAETESDSEPEPETVEAEPAEPTSAESEPAPDESAPSDTPTEE